MTQGADSEVLVVASRNPGKVEEIRRLLAHLPAKVVALSELAGAPQLNEPHFTFAENAVAKATTAARATGHLALADDSGLVVPALGGAPGVRSSRVAASDDERIRWLLTQMRALQGEQRRAHFVCVAALVAPGGEVLGTWTDRVEGLITHEPQGQGGFGYDPVFFYDPAKQTFGQMSAEHKNSVSHRGKALRAFVRDLPDVLRRYKANSQRGSGLVP